MATKRKENPNPKWEIRTNNTPTKDVFWFVLIARNGKIVVQSETYTKKAKAIKGIQSVENAVFKFSPVVDATTKKPKRIYISKY